MSLAKFYIQGSRRKIQKWMGQAPTDPYMKFKEVDFFTELLLNFKPARVLEYGSGVSTAYFNKFLSADAEWFSVENNRQWYDRMKNEIPSDRIDLVLVEVDENFDQAAETDEYVHYADKIGGKFDFILVDGINRENCIDMAHKYLSENGILVVHDSNRVQYHPHIKQFPNWMIIQDFRKTAGGFGLASNNVDLTKLVDWKRHSSIWSADSAISNLFKFKYLMGKKSKPFKLEVSTSAG